MIRKQMWLWLALAALTLVGCMKSPQAKSDGYIAYGKKLLEKHDAARAILQFRNAARVLPQNPEAYYELGMAYLDARDFRPALVSFRKALELDPKHAGAKLKIAEMMAGTGNPDLLKQAKGDLQELLQGGAATSEVLDTLAMTQMKLGDPAGAAEVLERAASEFGTDLRAYVMLAQAKLRQKDLAGAEAALKKGVDALPNSSDAHRSLAEFYIAQGRLPDAESELRRAVAADGAAGAALFDLARVVIALGRKQEGEQTFQRLAAIDGYKPIYGIFLFQDGRHDEAVKEFERVAQQNPDDRTARTYLLTAYQLLGRAADVDRVLAAALQKNRKDVDALLKQAEILIERGAYDKSETDLNEILKLNPSMPEAHYVRAQLYRGRGNQLEYRQNLAETLRLNPALLSVRLELARDYMAAKDGQGALGTLDGALPAQKRSAELLAARNWALWTKGDLVEMRKGIDQGLASERSAEFLLQDALWKFRAGNSASAQAVLQEVLKLDPANLMALRALNGTYLGRKDSAMALEEVKRYAAAVPKAAPVQNFLGQLLLAKGDVAQARTVLTAARAASPNSPELDFSLTQVDYFDRNYDNAASRLQNILSRNPKNSVALLWLGTVELKRGNHKAAIENLRQSLELNPDNSTAGNDLAYELAEYTGNLDEALKYAQHAVELAPNQPDYADTLGWILYRKGLYPSAIPYLEQASKDPQNAIAKYHLAMAYTKAGDRKRGTAALQAALKLDPNVPEAKAARDLLGSPAGAP